LRKGTATTNNALLRPRRAPSTRESTGPDGAKKRLKSPSTKLGFFFLFEKIIYFEANFNQKNF